MSFSEMTKILKQRNKGKIVFVKVGAFYIAVAEDAVFLNKLLNLKCTCYTKYTCKVGVPIDSLQKYLDKLEEEKYAYIVYSLDKEKTEYKQSTYKMVNLVIYLSKSPKEEKLVELNKIDCELNIQRILLRIMCEKHWIDKKKFEVAIDKIRRNRENSRRFNKILWQEQLEIVMTAI